MSRETLRILLPAALALTIAGCAARAAPVPSGSASPLPTSSQPVGAAPASGAVAFVPDAAGANDFALNALALSGLRAEAHKLGLGEPAVVTNAASAGSQLVIGRGASLEDDFVAASMAKPGVSFVLLDAPAAEAPNLRTVDFELADGAIGAGALAAQHSQTHTVGFVGGQATDNARRLLAAFESGAQGSRVLAAYAGSDDNQNDAKRVAQGLIAQDADVLFAASYPSGLGTIAAASQLRRQVIGIDYDQYDVAPNAVIASVVKRVDLAAAQALDDYAGARLGGGAVHGQVTLEPVLR